MPRPLRDYLEGLATHLHARYAARTASHYLRIAEAFVEVIGEKSFRDVSTGTVEAFLVRPRAKSGTPSPATLNQELAGLLAFFRFVGREERETTSPAEGVPFRPKRFSVPRCPSPREVTSLFEAAARHLNAWHRARDLAILAVLSQLALRVHELVALDRRQVDDEAAALLQVQGKGGTTCDMPMNAPTRALLADWLEVRALRATGGERALFVSQRGGRLSVRAVQHMLAALHDRAGEGSSAPSISPHQLRHGAATTALSLGSDLQAVQALLRHRSIASTVIYTHAVDERRRAAIEKLGVLIPRHLVRGEATPGNHGNNGEKGSPPLDSQAWLDAISVEKQPVPQ